MIPIAAVFLSFFFGAFYYQNYHGYNSFPGKEGVLSLTFDDGLRTQYENAFPMMQKHGFTGTLYYTINATRFYELSGRELMTIENVIEMHNAGWEIGGHSVNHPDLTKLSEEELRFELEYPIEFFREHGIEVKTLAYPFWHHNNDVVEHAQRLYISGRVIDLNKDIDFYRLKSIGVEDKHTPEEVCSWVGKAGKNGQWIILVFHSIEEEKTERWDTSAEDFESILECVKETGISVKNIEEVISRLKR
jgi:peptidoglycan/xylan/chitin deacetylase (PgdA/CDA1 family)